MGDQVFVSGQLGFVPDAPPGPPILVDNTIRTIAQFVPRNGRTVKKLTSFFFRHPGCLAFCARAPSPHGPFGGEGTLDTSL